jgi:7,8-dihydroneopterin aldolase/epimerase/oxygenase
MRPDAILVSGIEFEASHGYTAAERKFTRRFRCHVEIEQDLGAAAASDRIHDTVDYRTVCAIAVEVGTGQTYRLLEALAGAIADGIRNRYPGRRVTVTLEKVAPPCPGAPAWAGVRISR